MIDVSVVVVNYNTFELTCKCISSVIQFTQKISYEIILVDNASTERDSGDFKKLFPELVILTSKKNLGFAGGNNAGITLAKGNTILLLNSDAEVTSNVIGDYYSKLYHLEESVKVISCKLTFPDGRVQPSCGRFPSIKLQVMDMLRLSKLLSKKQRGKLFLGNLFDYEHPVYPDWVWGTFFMFKKEILSVFAEGKLSETYFLYMEDMEWCYHIADSGGKIYFDPQQRIIHHRGASTISFFGESLNPTIKSNFVNLVERQRGKVYARLYFGLLKLNNSVSRMMKGTFDTSSANDK